MKSIRNHYKNSKHILVILTALLASSQAQSWNARTSIDAGNSIIYSIFGSDLDGDGFGEVIVLYDDNKLLRSYESMKHLLEILLVLLRSGQTLLLHRLIVMIISKEG